MAIRAAPSVGDQSYQILMSRICIWGNGPVTAEEPIMAAPDTIVLVHGFWVTPRSWENWVTHYEQKGYRVIAPGYPGFEVEVEALNADPSIIMEVTVPAIIEKIEGVIRDLASPPIIIGHSAGGAFTQILLDHGYGAAGVALNSAPTEGVRVVPLSQVKSTFPVLKSPANRHKAVGLSLEEWSYAFTNTFTPEESKALYERYHIPANGGILWGSVLANFQPGHQDTWVDYHNDNRAPLLFISGSEDHIMPPAVQQSNAKHYQADTVTEIKEYQGYSHLLPAQQGWQEIADYALDWALQHARTAHSPSAG
jgi:pimeloyl-ACP methyl ester carboxylesterase